MPETPRETTVEGAERFEFGENWRRFAADVEPTRIEAARASLAEKLGSDSLDGSTFLDVGSGSGLFSLAAVRMGADRVHSLDYDHVSVETALGLKRRFASEAAWTVERADVLDAELMHGLGTWDVVYSWGVLHHTGDMWKALDIVAARVRPGGRLFISIYNDQGWPSRTWTRIKRLYNSIPGVLRVPYSIAVMLPIELKSLARHTLKLHPHEYLREWRGEGRDRGMDRWRDLVDWVGGYPFEVASPDQIFAFYAQRGFELRALQTVGGGHGCNEFVFELPASRVGS